MSILIVALIGLGVLLDIALVVLVIRTHIAQRAARDRLDRIDQAHADGTCDRPHHFKGERYV